MPKPNPPEIEHMDAPHIDAPKPASRASLHFASRIIMTVALLSVGAGVGGVAVNAMHQPVVAAPMNPVAINTLTDWSTATIKGKVVEIYGNKYVVEDETARTLVETGRTGDNQKLASMNDEVTVQGRLEHGFMHAQFIVGADGKTIALEPPPHGGPRDWLQLHAK